MGWDAGIFYQKDIFKLLPGRSAPFLRILPSVLFGYQGQSRFSNGSGRIVRPCGLSVECIGEILAAI